MIYYNYFKKKKCLFDRHDYIFILYTDSNLTETTMAKEEFFPPNFKMLFLSYSLNKTKNSLQLVVKICQTDFFASVKPAHLILYTAIICFYDCVITYVYIYIGITLWT